MNYIRFVIPKNDEDSGRRQGLFQALDALDKHGKLSREEQQLHTEVYDWFCKHLKQPSDFTRSSKPHAKAVAISWFKDTATDHLRQMRIFASILDSHDIHVEMLTTDRPGYIVYEDEFQIVAEPFSETET